MDVIIDNREQNPWAFPESVNVSWGTLNAGDYALKGDNRFALERKSLDDFLGTVSTGWERFNRELDRMKAASFPARIVLVEDRFEYCCFREREGKIIPPEHNHPKLSPAFVNKRIAELAMQNVTVLFADNRHFATALALAIFNQRKKELDNNEHG